MSHRCGGALSEKIFSISSKQSKTKDQRCPVNALTADSKRAERSNKCDGQHKTKRLKTRKERSQKRGGWKETSKIKSHHHHCHCQSRKDAAFFQNCCHSSCQWTSRRNTPVSVPVAQEPSIITNSRLIGHHGLFNHEVKSIDIERLLSKESKMEQNGKKVTEKNNKNFNVSSSALIPAPLSSDGLLGVDVDDVSVKKKADLDLKTHDDTQETAMKNLQGSDLTPGQRPQQQPDVSSGSFKTIISSKHSPHSVESNAKNSNYFTSEKERRSRLTPSINIDNVETLNCKETRHVVFEQPLKNQNHQTQTDGLRSCSLQQSPTAEGFDIKDKRQDTECVSKTISALATRLCGSLHLPSLTKRRSLLSEIRNVLLKSLQEKHGPLLQTNLKMYRCVGDDVSPTQTLIHDKTVSEEDQPPDTTFKTTGSRQFTLEFSSQLNQNLHQSVDDFLNPMETSVASLDETFRPGFSQHFQMDFEPFEAAASDLFVQSPELFHIEKTSSSELWEDFGFKSEGSAPFECFQDSFVNHSRGISCEILQDNNNKPFDSYQDGQSADLTQFPQEQADRFSFPSLFPARIQYHHQSYKYQHFDQLSGHPTFMSSNTDMRLYPPSHMLERSSTPPPSSLPSPEYWTFPPMRLY